MIHYSARRRLAGAFADYLRDNMAVRLEDTVQRGHYFCIVDEVDSILIDEARTPLIISGVPEAAADHDPVVHDRPGLDGPTDGHAVSYNFV